MKKILYLFLILTLFPAASFAQQGRDAGNKTATCSKIMEKLSNAQRALNGSQEKIRNRQGDINGNIENRRENRISQMEKIRDKWSQNRADHFEKLRERAQTEEQKQAVEGFVIAVESALIIRQEAFDRAIRDYQVEFDALAESRQSEVKQRAEDYKTAVEKAYEDAKNSCETKIISEIQQALREALNQAKDQYRNRLSGIQNYSGELAALAKEKRDSVKEATDVFHETVRDAAEVLRASFGEK